MAPLIDSFEDGDYTADPAWSDFDSGFSGTLQVNQNQASDGSYSVEINGDGGSAGQSTGINLPVGNNYFSEGEILKIDFWIGHDNADMRQTLGVRDTDTGDSYRIYYPNQGACGSTSQGHFMDGNCNVSNVPQDEWLRMEWEFGSSEITASLYDSSDSLIIESSQSYGGPGVIDDIFFEVRDDEPGSGDFYTRIDNVRVETADQPGSVVETLASGIRVTTAGGVVKTDP